MVPRDGGLNHQLQAYGTTFLHLGHGLDDNSNLRDAIYVTHFSIFFHFLTFANTQKKKTYPVDCCRCHEYHLDSEKTETFSNYQIIRKTFKHMFKQ